MSFPATRLARYELRRFRGTLPRLALGFVLIIPLLYGAIYLTANWDPYGKLDRLPVAVVNEDEPTTVSGRTVTAGDDFVESLQDKPTFAWRVTDAEDAAAGLRDGRYYMTVTVPSDFSTNLVSGAGEDPRRAQIQLRTDDANGFVIGSITAKARESIELAVDESAIESYFEAVFANLDTIRDGMTQASDGSTELADGLDQAHDGATQLADGADRADQAGAEAADGAAQVAAGTSTAHAGAQSLDAGLVQLRDGSAELADGAGQVADGTSQLNATVLPPLEQLQEDLPALQADAEQISGDAVTITTQVSELTGALDEDVAALQAGMTDLEERYPELADDPTWQQMTGVVGQVGDHTADIDETAQRVADAATRIDERIRETDLTATLQTAHDNLVALDDGAQQVAAGADTLHEGLVEAQAGSAELSSGLAELETGSVALADGLTELSGGLATLHTGVADLADGLTQLQEGAHQLRDGLVDGVERLPVYSQAEQQEAASVLSSPADVQMTVDNPATYYGRGVAPMFFSIALWVFGISVFMVVRPISARVLSGRANAVRLALTAWFPIAWIAVVGGLLMVFTVWLTLGLAPVHPVLLVLLTVLGALCFSAIAHMLRTALGAVATALTLVLLILQLPASGGTYPSAILPGFFSAIAPFLPMTYLIDAYRIVISGGPLSRLALDVIVLAVITGITMLLCTVVVRRRQRFTVRDLHPVLVTP
ncbi:YhgE/Pip domain-containing protein [Ornithinimicrobium sp. F0845]|uniref:YhgE/Pip domain-containing protein n=1 Tax=Ornithinimicrobium sp. F0845 TaxID=2926412 RepID=UPI001FF36B2E|nr:YhgE/Pip domain-containing protein [Ornithinimicrobium sp. F0845]MCK0110623.1 YhgE/Pip domain-containing protein [Ornithinimicrobium sp. F0845]